MLLLLAFYFSILVPSQVYPMVIGPYADWGVCDAQREWLDRRGYTTDDCELMPTPQPDSVEVETLFLPPEPEGAP